jgi:hypothetical protein
LKLAGQDGPCRVTTIPAKRCRRGGAPARTHDDAACQRRPTIVDGCIQLSSGHNRIDPRAEAHAPCAAKAGDRGTRRRPAEPAKRKRDRSEAELELMRAMQEYEESSGRMFPTWSEVLEVLKGLGYQKEGSGRPPAA